MRRGPAFFKFHIDFTAFAIKNIYMIEKPHKYAKLNVDWDKIKQMFLFQGYGIKELASWLGCSRGTISEHLRALGVNTLNKIDNFDLTSAIALYEKGMSVKAIAERINADYGALYRAFHRKGVKFRERQEALLLGSKSIEYIPPEKQQLIERMYTLDKYTLVRISKEVGITANCIARFLRAKGIKVLSRGEVLAQKYNEILGEKLSSTDWDAIAKRYANGESLKKLAKELGLNNARVARLISERGVQIRKCGDAINVSCLVRSKDSNWDFFQIAKEYQAGATLKQLSLKHKHPRYRISKWFRENGIRTRSNLPPGARRIPVPEEQRAPMLADYDAGLTIIELSLKYDLTRDRVSRFLREQGKQIRAFNPKLGPKFNTQNVEAIVSEYQNGASASAITRKYPIALKSVLKILRSKGIKIRRQIYPRIHKQEVGNNEASKVIS